MRVYTIHRRLGAVRDRDEYLAVKEGFSWLALILAPLWALWHRAWWGLVVLLVLNLAWELLGAVLDIDPVTLGIGGVAVSLWFACTANDWWRDALARRGYHTVGIIAAPDGEAALLRHLDREW